MSAARLGRLHEVMAGYVERGDVPGLVTLVSRLDGPLDDTVPARRRSRCATC